MSVLLSNYQQIASNPANSSHSKALYSFSKEPRFYGSYRPPHNKNLTYFEGKNYKKVSTLTKKSNKFGDEKRPDNIFVDINNHFIKNPSPDNYSLPSAFKKSHGKLRKSMGETKSSSFGAPRNAFKKVVSHNTFNHQPFDEKDPGPGHYACEDPLREFGGNKAS